MSQKVNGYEHSIADERRAPDSVRTPIVRGLESRSRAVVLSGSSVE